MGSQWRGRNTFRVAVIGLMFISVLCVAGERQGDPAPRNVTLTGKVMDLHSLLTGKFESSDKAKCTRDCIRAGVPAVLETADGLVFIGEGSKGAARTMAPLAFENAELKGKLFEKHGIRYIDISSAKIVKAEPVMEPDDDDVWTPDPQDAVSGACCLPDGTCVEEGEDNCLNRDGAYYADVTCDEIDCQ